MRVASKRVGLCWLGRSVADRVAATRADASQAVSASCHCNQNFCPPSGSDAHLQIPRAPRSAATWVDVIEIWRNCYNSLQKKSMAMEGELSVGQIGTIASAAFVLTHWGRDKMAAIFQTTFSNAFSWMRMYRFRIRFHWSLFPRDQLTIFQHWFR